MEILTLSEDQKSAEEPGLTLMSWKQKNGLSGGACPQFIHFLPTKIVALLMMTALKPISICHLNEVFGLRIIVVVVVIIIIILIFEGW